MNCAACADCTAGSSVGTVRKTERSFALPRNNLACAEYDTGSNLLAPKPAAPASKAGTRTRTGCRRIAASRPGSAGVAPAVGSVVMPLLVLPVAGTCGEVVRCRAGQRAYLGGK